MISAEPTRDGGLFRDLPVGIGSRSAQLPHFPMEITYYQVRSVTTGTLYGNKYASRKLAEESVRVSCTNLPKEQQERFIKDCGFVETELFIYNRVEHL